MKTQKGLSGAKHFCVAVLIFSLFNGLVPADTQQQMKISRVEVAGNITIKASKILSLAQSREAMIFDEELADEDVTRIAELEGVDYAYYNTETIDGGIVLTFVVLEKNLVREIDFQGNDKLNDKVLSKQLSFAEGDYLDVFMAKQGAEEIKNYYLKKGYPFAIVQLDSEQVEYGKVIYNIIENQRVRIKDLDFQGNQALSDGDLKKGLKSKPRKLLVIPNYLNVENLEKDVLNIEKAYHQRGYINVKVDVERDFSKDKKKVYLTFNVDEGQVFVVEDITIIGNSAIDTTTLRDNMKLMEGWIYSEEKADRDAEEIQSLFKEIGFINAKVNKSREFLAGGKVKVFFNIEQGNRFRIGKINITGNEETNDKVIRRVLAEYDFLPGQWYDASIATGNGTGRLEQNVKRATYAESVFITPQGDDPNYRDPLVSLAEGDTGMIMFGAGVGSNDGVVGQVVFEQRNFDISNTPDRWSDLFSGDSFKGAGQKLRIALEPGTEYSRYSVSFTEPYLNDKPIQLDTTFSSFTRDRDDYDEDRMGAFVSFTKRFDNDWDRGISIRIEEVSLKDVVFDAPAEIFNYRDSTLLAGFKIFTRKSTVDNRYNPTTGYIFDISGEPVVGDDNFGILSLTNRWYKTLYEDIAERKTVLETKVYGAAIVGDAPPFEKFYAGGIGSIRGFEYRGISTLADSVVPGAQKGKVGSDWITTASSEIAVPLGQGETMAALFFADAAAIDTGGIRASVGAGIQIMIPQFFGPVPMRFELAAPMMKEDQDETQPFSFSIGRLF